MKLRVADCVADCVPLAIPQSPEWQHIGNQINAAFIFARADFVNVHHYLGLRGNRLTMTAAAAARRIVQYSLKEGTPYVLVPLTGMHSVEINTATLTASNVRFIRSVIQSQSAVSRKACRIS
jgi:hypothetical protein